MYCPKIDDALMNNVEIRLLPDFHDKIKEMFAKYTVKVGEELVTPNYDLGQSAAELMRKVLPPARYAIQNMVYAGLNLLIGRPKAGKSWMALQMGCRVSAGLPFLGNKTRQGKVLYLALEDEEGRIQRRLFNMGYDTSGEGLENLRLEYTSTWSKRASKDTLKILGNYLNHWDGEVSLVIIDTLQRFRGVSGQDSSANVYASDYHFMNGIQELASKYNTPFEIVHHTKKATTGDYITDGSGSNGVMGGSDNVITLYKEHNEDYGLLKGGGRDISELNQWLYWDKEYCTFFPVDEIEVPEECRESTADDKKKATVSKTSNIREAVFEVICKRGKRPRLEIESEVKAIRPDQLESTITKTVSKMINDNFLKIVDGKYLTFCLSK
jgi:hypothetical protein